MPENLRDDLQEDINRFREITLKTLIKRAEAAHRSAWQIIIENTTPEEMQELSEIVDKLNNLGYIIAPEPKIEIKIVKLPPVTVH